MPRMKAAWYHRLDIVCCCFGEDSERSMGRARANSYRGGWGGAAKPWGNIG